MALVDIALKAGATKTIFASMEGENPPVSVAVRSGEVSVSVAENVTAAESASKVSIQLKSGDSIIVRAKLVKIWNSGKLEARCEYGIAG